MKCAYCKSNFKNKDATIGHMESAHADELVRDSMTASQALYFGTHGSLNGKCMCGCDTPTEWNDKTGKPHKVSPDPKCKERLREIALRNHIASHGRATLLDDMNHQKKMQANRSIAGEYVFSDGGKVGYLAKLEHNFLKFCDVVMEFKSNMFCDFPDSFTYEDTKTNRKRQYIPDFYLPDYNLLVEIKDGGDKTNTNPAFIEETKYKVYMKDDVMKKQTKYNYIRISGTNYGPFLDILFKIVSQDAKNEKHSKNIVIINEAVNAKTPGPVDGVILVTTRYDEYGLPMSMGVYDGTRDDDFGVVKAVEYLVEDMRYLGTKTHANDLLRNATAIYCLNQSRNVQDYTIWGDGPTKAELIALDCFSGYFRGCNTEAEVHLPIKSPLEILSELGFCFNDQRSFKNCNDGRMDFIKIPKEDLFDENN